MSSIPDFLQKLFVRNAKVLGWQWVPEGNVVDAQNRPVSLGPTFVSGDDYVVLRLAEMYLRHARVLWRERYPVVHSFVAYGDAQAQRTVATVAGPAQLKDLGSANLDRLIGLAYRLAGPIVYDGQDIELLAGLYAVPAADGAKVLIDTISQLAGLVPLLKQATEVANIVKAGTEGLLGLSNTDLVLGVRDTLRLPGVGQGRTAKPGFVVALNKEQAAVEPAMLWVKDGRLLHGPNPLAARPFDACDMMLFELHRGPSRAMSWATLPALAAGAKAFNAALRDVASDKLRNAVEGLYRTFKADLRAIDDLSAPDKAAIRALVSEDLRSRILAIEGGGLFEKRGVAEAAVEVELRGFSARAIREPAPGLPLPARRDGDPLFA